MKFIEIKSEFINCGLQRPVLFIQFNCGLPKTSPNKFGALLNTEFGRSLRPAVHVQLLAIVAAVVSQASSETAFKVK